MKVICTKTFTDKSLYPDVEATFIKNLKYHLMQYEGQSIFYVGVIPKNGPVAAYPLGKKYRCNFMTLKELRKQKLEKINNS